MNLKEKILSTSNSYNHYRKNYEMSKKEIELLKEEINKLKSDKQLSLKEEFMETYEDSISFCSRNYMKFYLSDEFEDRLKELTSHLDSENRERFKLYLLRVLFVNMIVQDSLFSSEELENQEKFRDFEEKEVSENRIGQYSFFGDYNIHPFIATNLNDDEMEFIRDKDIIDAGAFTGDTSLPLSQLTDGNVYAFEPYEDSFMLLKKNIDENNISNIVGIMKSLGNINGERTLYLSGDNVQGISSDRSIRKYTEELNVEETTVDDFVRENDLNLGFITVDVEGAEMDLLKGAVNTIREQKPIMIISIYHRVDDYFDIIPFIANLGLGYEFEIFKEQPWPFIADTVVKCTIKER